MPDGRIEARFRNLSTFHERISFPFALSYSLVGPPWLRPPHCRSEAGYEGATPGVCSCCSKLQRAFIACMLFPEVFRKGWRDIVIICQYTGHLLAFALAGVDRPVLSFS